jgi:hypothetical protein
MFVKHFYLHKSNQTFNMNKSNWLSIAGAVVLALFSLFFGMRRCDGGPTTDDITDNFTKVTEGKAFVDSLLLSNRDLTRSRDSLSVELGVVLLNMPEDKSTQVITRTIVKYVYRDSFKSTVEENIALQEVLDSLQKEYNGSVENFDRNNEMQEQRYQQLLSEKLSQAASIPCVTFYNDEYLTATATCSNGGMKELAVTARDSLITTHTTSRKWFLGRKSYHVFVTNSNPYVTTTGVAYIIDKKLRRKARRNNR